MVDGGQESAIVVEQLEVVCCEEWGDGVDVKRVREGRE